MIFTSLHGSPESDIYQSGPYELVRSPAGFGMHRVTIIKDGVKVHDVVAGDDAVERAMAWCRRDANPIPEVDFATHAEPQR